MFKLLVAEDDVDLRQLCVHFFKFKAYETFGVSSRDDLYNNLDSFSPDIILMDIMLAADDGREICRELKISHDHIKIILVSAREDLVETYKECNADAGFLKPYSIKTIANKIAELMNEE